jgi:hypothetical protein
VSESNPKVRQSLVFWGMVSGYGFGFASACAAAALYGPLSQKGFVLAAVFGALLTFGGIAGNEYAERRRG